MTHSERMVRFAETDLYVVITESFCAGRSSLDVLDDVLAAGVKLVQMREKGLEAEALYELALQFRERTAKAGALLIVNDRVDVALAVEADGVHLGQTDLPIDAARRIAPEMILGGSTHDVAEAQAAQQAGASYVNIGPVFPTQTKDVPTGVVGPDMITAIAPHLTIPFTTMGGIKAHNVGEVLARGARHVAVVTAVTAADDVQQAAAELREAILAGR
jgi:thiamine-phosphate pyrophosphorylase